MGLLRTPMPPDWAGPSAFSTGCPRHPAELAHGTQMGKDAESFVNQALTIGAAVVLLAACGRGGPARSDPAAFRVALLTPGSIGDGGWNAIAYAGLRRIERELGAQIGHAETRTPAEFDEGFRDFAQRGYDLVFGHGFEFQDAANRVGAEFPQTVFITSSGSAVRANVAPMVFRLEQSTYLCGILAGHLSRSKILGLVGGMDIPPVRGGFLAFEAGAKSVDPQIRILTAHIGNWEDAGAAKEAALAQIGRGADILIHNADAAGLGVFQAARESDRVLAFGTNKNQNQVAPEITIASAVLDIPQAFVAAARMVRENRFHAAPILLGMKDGVVRLELNPAFEPRIPAAARMEVERARERILAGTLTVPSVEFVETAAAAGSGGT